MCSLPLCLLWQHEKRNTALPVRNPASKGCMVPYHTGKEVRHEARTDKVLPPGALQALHAFTSLASGPFLRAHELGSLYPLSPCLKSSFLRYPNHTFFLSLHFPLSTPPHLLRQGPSLSWNLPSKPGLLASELQEFAPLPVELQTLHPVLFHKGSEN